MSTSGSATFPSFITPFLPANCVVQRCPTSRADAPQRILIAKFGAFGDILMATPLLTALRCAYPDAHITWVVEEKYREAIDANPFIDEVLLWNSGYWISMRSTRPRNWVKNQFGFRWLNSFIRIKSLLHKRYDLLISFHPEQWQFLLDAAAARTSVGIFETPEQAKRDYTRRYTKAFTEAGFKFHRTDQYLLPLQALDLPPTEDKQMVLGFTAEDVQAADDFLRQQGHAGAEPLVVVAPMTTWTSRVWPAENYVRLSDALMRSGHAVLLISSPASQEQEAVRAIASQVQVPPMLALGSLSFRQMAALLARASLVISGDTSPMHIAAAVGTPYLAIFGPTPVPGRAPLAGRGLPLAHAVPCGPCDRAVCTQAGKDYLRCLWLVTVEEALAAAEKLLVPVLP